MKKNPYKVLIDSIKNKTINVVEYIKQTFIDIFIDTGIQQNDIDFTEYKNNAIDDDDKEAINEIEQRHMEMVKDKDRNIGLVLLVWTPVIFLGILMHKYIFDFISSSWEFILRNVGTSSLIGLLVTNFITIYSINKNQKSDMKKQSNWRGKVYEMEQNSLTSYTLNDLFTINSFINPYTSTGSASYFVNEMIYNLYLGRKEAVKVCHDELILLLKKGFLDIQHSSNHSLLSLKEEDLKPNRLLTREEAINVKLCCHVLLKAEWENKI